MITIFLQGFKVVRHKSAKKVLEVAQRIKEVILNDHYQIGDYLPSERAFQKQFHLSRETIRKGLEELIREGLIDKKRCSGYFIPKKSKTTSLKTVENSILFLPTTKYIDENEPLIWQGAREQCLKSGLHVIQENLSFDLQSMTCLKEIKKKGIGILSDITEERVLLHIHKAGIPIVHFYHPMEQMPFDTILQDDMLGIQLAYDHLISQGHRKICLLDKSLSMIKTGIVAHNQLRRRIGYQFAAEQTNTFDQKLIVDIDKNYDYLEKENECFAKITQSGATALIFPNSIHFDILTEGLNRSLAKFSAHKNTANAIKNNKFGIIVWGESQSTPSNYSKTHINWSKQQMGREGVRRLIEKMNEPNLPPIAISIPTFLVVGNSSGKGPYFNKNLQN